MAVITSRVPAAVDALVALCRASPALAGVEIVDGPPIIDLANPDVIFIGWQPSDGTAVTFAQDFNAAGARTRDEEFGITCYAEAHSGDTDITARRVRAFELLAAVETALRATDAAPTAPTLNGAVLWAHLTAGTVTQAQSQGALVGVEFTVSCRARI